MLKISQAIIVEGKYDKIKLQSVVDATIITTNGFGLYKDKEKTELIRIFARRTGIIILTDSDGAGFQIRNHIKSVVGDGKVYNVYIPDIFGKEKRKAAPSKEGKLGVEGISPELLREAFLRAGINGESETPRKRLTKADLMENGLIGTDGCAERRKKLQKALGLPELLSANSLLEILNTVITEDEYNAALLSL